MVHGDAHPDNEGGKTDLAQQEEAQIDPGWQRKTSGGTGPSLSTVIFPDVLYVVVLLGVLLVVDQREETIG